jgi:hypothetical protein
VALQRKPCSSGVNAPCPGAVRPLKRGHELAGESSRDQFPHRTQILGKKKVAKDALELGNHSSEPEFAILPVHRVCISSSYVCRKVDGGWLQGSAKFGLLDWVHQGSNGRQPRLAMAVQTWLPFFFAAISKAQR